MAGISKQRAIRILSEVDEDKRFFVNDGNVLSQLKQVPGALRKMKKDTFEHHVNDEKNDFAKWINEVLGDKELAKKLTKLNKKSYMSKSVSARVKKLGRMQR